MIIDGLTFDERFTNTYNRLFVVFKNIGLRKFKSAVIAEDLAQNAFVNSYSTLKRDSTEANMRTYITTIFHNNMSLQAQQNYKEALTVISTDTVMPMCTADMIEDENSFEIEDKTAAIPFELVEFESVIADLSAKITNPVAKQIVENIIDTSSLPAEVVAGSAREVLRAIESHINIPYNSAYWYLKRYVVPCIHGYEFNKGVSNN